MCKIIINLNKSKKLNKKLSAGKKGVAIRKQMPQPSHVIVDKKTKKRDRRFKRLEEYDEYRDKYGL